VGFVFAHRKKIALHRPTASTGKCYCFTVPYPAAAMNFILTEKFGQDPNLAASIVVLSTFFSVITIPLVFWLIL